MGEGGRRGMLCLLTRAQHQLDAVCAFADKVRKREKERERERTKIAIAKFIATATRNVKVEYINIRFRLISINYIVKVAVLVLQRFFILSRKMENEGKEVDVDEEMRQEIWRSRLRAMNERFEARLDENVFAGVRDEKIYHGLKTTAFVALHKNYADVCFCDQTKEYLVLEKGVAMHRYSMQGKQLQPSFGLANALTFGRMTWCAAANCLACHDPDADQIWILTSSCVALQTVKNEFATKAISYEPTANLLVVVDAHQSTKYPLDDLERDLEPTKALAYIDPECGPTWQLDCSALITRTEFVPEQLAGSYATTLYLMPLERDEDEESDGPVSYLKRRLNVSIAPVTALYFHKSSRWILVGDQQGAVSAWNLDLEAMMRHESAHASRIQGFSSHPSICGFLSHSQTEDASLLQVWSCNLRERIEAFVGIGKVLGLAVVEDAATLVVLTQTVLSYFTMHQLYCFYAPLTSRAIFLFSTQNPMYPTKIIVVSGDNSVRIFSSAGRQLNVQLLPKDPFHVGSAVYSENNDRLFTIIMKTGEILVSDTSVCPMKFKQVFISDGPVITCLSVYEYFDEIRNNDGRRKNPRVFYPIKIRIIAGTTKGYLVIINETTGKHEITYRAHNGLVKQLQSSVTSQRVVSLGSDNSIKVWRIFADLHDALALYYELYFTIPIFRISSMGLILCIAHSSENSSVHQLFMEDMRNRVRLEHHCSKDHTGKIVDMITSETLEICATSSVDNTIRIWDQENCLLKILEINTCARVMTFSSVLGDIVFGAGRHLFKIPHENYLPPKYRAKIVANELLKEEEEDSVIEDVQYNIYDDLIDRNLMLRPVVSTPLASLDVTRSDKPRVDILIQKQICALYEYRDEDIRKIRDYQFEPTKKVAHRALMTSEDWKKYVTDLLNSMTRPVPETPKYDFKSIMEAKSIERKDYNERGVFYMLYGYSVDELDEIVDLKEIIKSSKLPLHGFLPNSVLYKPKEVEIPKVHTPQELSIKKEPVKYKYPPEFYPDEEEDEERRPSISLSQLMAESMDKDEEAAA